MKYLSDALKSVLKTHPDMYYKTGPFAFDKLTSVIYKCKTHHFLYR